MVRADALQGVGSFEIQADGSMKVIMLDGRSVMLAPEQFVLGEAGLFVEAAAATQIVGATVASGGIGATPAILGGVAGAGGLAAAAGGGGGGGGDSTPAPATPTPPANTAPVFTSGTAGLVEEGSLTAYLATATDAQSNTLAYSVSGTDAALFQINSSTGVVTFRTAPDFEAPADDGRNNVYNITVSVSDGTASISQNVAITVANRNDVAPVFTSAIAAAVDEGQTTAYQAAATDADTATLVYSISGADAALFAIDAATGVVTFRNAPDFEAPSDAGGDNVYNIVVTASDGVAAVTRDVAITVRNLNDTAPVIAATASLNVLEGARDVMTASATDADGSALTYALSGADAALFAIDAAGKITFISPMDYETPADADGDGVYTFTITVSDGVATAAQAVQVTVDDGNDNAPRIVSADDARTIAEDGVVTAAGVVAFADADLIANHTLTITAGGEAYLGDFTAALTNTAADGAGQVSWSFDAPNAALQFLAAGQTLTQTYTLAISDGLASVNQIVTITITGANDAPTIASAVASGSITENGATSASGAIAFTDVDLADVHTVSVTPASAGYIGALAASVATDTTGGAAGSVAWTYSVNDSLLQYLAAGQTVTQSYNVSIKDGAGASTTQTVTITLTGVNDAPAYVSGMVIGTIEEDFSAIADGVLVFADVDLTDAHTVSFAPSASDYLGAFATSISNVATGDGAGHVSWTYTVNPALLENLGAGESLVQTYLVTLDDGKGGVVVETVTITIVGENDRPVVTSGSAVSIAEGATATVYTATASDADGDALTYSLAGTDAALFDINASNGAVTFKTTPDYENPQDAGANNVYDITVRASDGALTNNRNVAITVTNVNDTAPVAIGGHLDIFEDNTFFRVAPGLLENASDADGDALFLVSDAFPAHGSLSIEADGSFSYETNADYYGADSFTFRVSDGINLSALVTVSINVIPVADTPSVTSTTTNEDTMSSTGLVITRNAADGAEVAYFKITGLTQGRLFLADGVTAVSDGSFITAADGAAGLKYQPSTNFNGTASFTLRASTTASDDGLGGGSVQANIVVTPVNDAATFGGVAGGAVMEDTTTSVSGVLTVFDVDAGESSFQAATGVAGSYGTLNINTAGAWTYFLNNGLSAVQALNGGQALTDTVNVYSADGTAQAITIVINGVTDGNLATTRFTAGADVGVTYYGNSNTADAGNEPYTMGQGAASFGYDVSYTNTATNSAMQAFLADKEALIIPEMESGDGAIVATQIGVAVSNFVLSGGSLVVNSASGRAFLNGAFGFSLAESTSGLSTFNTTGAAGTLFANDAATLPDNSAVYGASTIASLPAGARVMYTNGATGANVFAVQYGQGQIVFLAWDWYNASPAGTANGGWLEVLRDSLSYGANRSSGANDPIILDLDGDGVSFATTASFDLNTDGQPETIAWATGDDGFLVMDLDGSGAIESGREMLSETFDDFGFGSSMEALRSLDTNVDGVVDAGDERFADLRVWRDANGDGASQADELSSLTDLGVVSINVRETPVDRVVDGQTIFAEGGFTRVDGSSGQYVGVDLALSGVSDLGVVSTSGSVASMEQSSPSVGEMIHVEFPEEHAPLPDPGADAPVAAPLMHEGWA